MAKKSSRVTIRDIAAVGGMHPSTVSLALRDDPRLPEETRAKIKQLAAKMGYEANPLVSAWLRHVRQPEVAQEGVGMAFMLGMEASELVAKESYYRAFIEGARAEALALGYVVSDILFGRQSPAELLKAIARLRYRGVRGVVIFDPAECVPPEVVRELESNFAVVAMLRCGGGHRFHRVSTDIAYNATLALKRLREIGCKRIAFPVKPGGVDRVRADTINAFLGQQHLWPEPDIIPLPKNSVEQSPELLLRWVKKHRPDAILSVNFAWYQVLQEGGYRMPEDLIFAHIGTDTRRWLPGVVNRAHEVGRAAVFKLAGLMTGNRFGAPEFPLATMVPGFWSDGENPISRRDAVTPLADVRGMSPSQPSKKRGPAVRGSVAKKRREPA